MKRLFALLLLFGCHEPFSNEDILFLKSLPRDVQFDVPAPSSGLAPTQMNPAQLAVYYNAMVDVAGNLNNGIFGVLDQIETITSSAAVVRDDDRRAWGPIHPDEKEKIEILLVVDRIRTATVVAYTSASIPLKTDTLYRYAFSARTTSTTAWTQIVYGESVVLRANDDEATGYFCYDLTAARMLDPKTEDSGSYCVSYDFQGDQKTVEFSARVAGSIYVNPDAAFSFHREGDGSGRFRFSQRGNVFPEEDASRPEITSIGARWDQTLAARADASICGGDAAYELWATECWNDRFEQTFILSNIPGFKSGGGLRSCPPEFQEPDAVPQPCPED